MYKNFVHHTIAVYRASNRTDVSIIRTVYINDVQVSRCDRTFDHITDATLRRINRATRRLFPSYATAHFDTLYDVVTLTYHQPLKSYSGEAVQVKEVEHAQA